MPFLSHLAHIWPTAPEQIMMRVFSLMSLRFAHYGFEHRALGIGPCGGHFAPPMDPGSGSKVLALAPSIPAIPILGFRTGPPERSLGMASLDITNGRDGAPTIPQPITPLQPFRPGSLTPRIASVMAHHSKPGYQPPQTINGVDLGLSPSARESAAGPSLQGDDNDSSYGAQRPSIESILEAFEVVPLTPSPQQSVHGDDGGREHQALERGVLGAIWEWICLWWSERRLSVGQEPDLEAAKGSV